MNGSINIPSNDNLTWGGTYGAGTPTISANNSVGLYFYPGGGTSGVGMAINPSGNVLIGKTSQANTNYKLDVNGSARANEIVVNTTGADFVFEKNYKLPKLEEVEAYINKNHHLIDIPTADVMKQYGVAVGELNTKLLQKVEELTLYLIDKDNQDKEKDAKLQSQQKQLAEQNKS
ncbi:hypothetical protein [Mucilaginibacter sp.]|uniref:hypothetical protein n=1 Tax=Mucilaginibacter sp. TaxID=1882438 RepID=UPI002620632D|nr:hypothetical protein [Mucilaginibacter sp.]